MDLPKPFNPSVHPRFPALARGCSRHHHLNRPSPICYSSNPDDGYLDRCLRLIHCSYGQRVESRARETAIDSSQDRSGSVDVYRHAQSSVDSSEGIRACSFGRFRNFLNVSNVRSQLDKDWRFDSHLDGSRYLSNHLCPLTNFDSNLAHVWAGHV